MSSSDSLKDHDYNGTPATQVDPEEERLKASNENLYKVVLLGIIFLIMFSAFNSASVLITPIYQQLGFSEFGKISTLCIYVAFAFNDFLAPFELKVFGLKVGLFLGGLGYVIFMFGGLLLTACKYQFESTEGICSGGAVISINAIASIICGISAAMLWLAQSKYIDCCGNKYNKGKFFGVFWSIFQMSFILGNVLGAYLLKFFNPFVYFVTMGSLVLLACLSFLLLPPVRDVTAEQEIQRPVGEDIKFRIRGIKRITFMKAFRPMIPYYLYSGFSIAVYSTFSYRVINLTTADSEDSVKNEKLEWCFVAQGFMSVINSSAVGKGSDLFGVKRAINLTNFGFLAAMLIAVFATDTLQYWLAVLMVVVWAFGDSSIRTLSNAIISKDFKGRLEAFAATRVITETGVVVGLLLSIGLGNVSEYYFIGVIVALTLIMQIIVYFYDPTQIDQSDLEDESVDDSSSEKV